MWQDSALFLHPEIGQSSPFCWAISVLNYTEKREKKENNPLQKIQKKKSSGDGAPKLQISVQRGQNWPWAKKVKKASAGESLTEFLGVQANPPKRVKNEPPGDSVENLPAFRLQRLMFDSLWRVQQDLWTLPQKLSQRLFFDFLVRGKF